MLKIEIDLNYHNDEIAKIDNSIGIIPYCNVDWRDKECNVSKVVLLLKTIASLSAYVSEIHIYCNEKLDELTFIKRYYPFIYFHYLDLDLELDNNVMVYPIGKYAMLDGLWKEYEYVFFTEADQVFFSKNLNVSKLNSECYISPHRFERCFNNCNKNKKTIYYNSIKYNLFNEPKEILDDDFFICSNFVESYGAAWIAKKEAVENVDFKNNYNSSLHVPCLAMFNSLKSLKTRNYYDFFVDHLSGYKNSLNKSNIDFEKFPICW